MMTTTNLTLAQIGYAAAALLSLLGLTCALRPAAARAAAKAFPRNTPAAWVLTALALFWVAVIVLNGSLGRFNTWKPAVYGLAPVSFFLIVRYMDELLAPRALGGLFLLVANPMLAAARWHPSAERVAVSLLAYVLVIAGIMLVLGPFYFRRACAWWADSDARARGVGGALLALAALFGYLAFTVY